MARRTHHAIPPGLRVAAWVYSKGEWTHLERATATGNRIEYIDMPSKWKIYHEKPKDRQTSHWDWDSMTTAQIDDAIRSSQENATRTSLRSERSLTQIWQNLLGWFRRSKSADK
jgi:hypothetical protein